MTQNWLIDIFIKGFLMQAGLVVAMVAGVVASIIIVRRLVTS